MAAHQLDQQKRSARFELILDIMSLVAALDGLLAPFTRISAHSKHSAPPFGIASCNEAESCSSVHKFDHLLDTLKANDTKLAYFVVSLLFVSLRGLLKGTATLIKLSDEAASGQLRRMTSKDEYWGLARATVRFGLLAAIFDLCQYEARVWADGLFGGTTAYTLAWGPALHVTVAAGVACLVGLLGKAAAVVDTQMEEKGMKGENGRLKSD